MTPSVWWASVMLCAGEHLWSCHGREQRMDAVLEQGCEWAPPALPGKMALWSSFQIVGEKKTLPGQQWRPRCEGLCLFAPVKAQ